MTMTQSECNADTNAQGTWTYDNTILDWFVEFSGQAKASNDKS